MQLRSDPSTHQASRTSGSPRALDAPGVPADTGTAGPTAKAATPQHSRRNHESRETLARRVRAEFLEMPGMQLTLRQAQRLFGLPGDMCLRVLGELIREGFLCRARDGMFARREFSRG